MSKLNTQGMRQTCMAIATQYDADAVLIITMKGGEQSLEYVKKHHILDNTIANGLKQATGHFDKDSIILIH